MAFQQEQFIISPSLNALLNIYKSSTQLIFSIIIFVIYNHPPIENIVSKKSTLFMLRIGDSYVHRIAYSYLTIYIVTVNKKWRYLHICYRSIWIKPPYYLKGQNKWVCLTNFYNIHNII